MMSSVNFDNITGKVLTSTNLSKLGIHLYHVSRIQLAVGSYLYSQDYLNRPHYSFFMPDPPKEFTIEPDYQARRCVERIFEHNRKLHYSKLPSRKTCLFANIRYDDAVFWRQKGARDDGIIYEIKPSKSSIILIADLTWYNYSVRVMKGLADKALQNISNHSLLSLDSLRELEVANASPRYWNGILGTSVGGETRLEALIEGSVKIKAEVATPDSK